MFFNMKGEKVKHGGITARSLKPQVNVDLMHQAYIRQMANARLGTHETKTRSEVAGGGSQALEAERHRSRPPGFDPCSRSGSAVARSIHRIHANIRSTCRRKCARLLCALLYLPKLPTPASWLWMNLILDEPKTRLMAQALNTLVGDSTRLGPGMPEKDAAYEMVTRSTNNLPDAKIAAGKLSEHP